MFTNITIITFPRRSAATVRPATTHRIRRVLASIVLFVMLCGLINHPPTVALAGAPIPASSGRAFLPSSSTTINPAPLASVPQAPVIELAILPELRLPDAVRRPPAAVASLFIAGDGPAMRGTRIAQTDRIDLYVGLHTLTPEEVTALAPQIEAYLQASEARFGTQLSERVSLAVYRPALAPSRGTRGIAYTAERRAEIYYHPGEDLDSALAVAVHELAHHLQFARYGEEIQRRTDTILLEGQATWITGDVWLQRIGAASWRERAQQLRDSGVPLRLLLPRAYGANTRYELWASFIDFLIEHYGMDTVDQLYRSGMSREPGSAAYQAITGSSLDELADAWRAWVDGTYSQVPND
ncbi:MAG TPA: hypothetical protein PKA05_14960 [Roseiflexaceae bacterium]|nr:hypothetical protein [Roseiflexaceae bacterium]HMP41678.1 hypothetical protein [Roseiflexaceae bacterium]